MNVKNILENVTSINPKFIGSEFFEWSLQQPTAKGNTGEKIVEALFTEAGSTVLPKEDDEHDRIIDGKKVEIKTAFLKTHSDLFTFYGYDPTDNPHYWLINLVYPNRICVVKMTRESFGNIKLGKSRKNIMITATEETLLAAGGEVVANYRAERLAA